MNDTPAPADPFRWWAPPLLLAAGLLCYANSFDGRYMLDDMAGLEANENIRHWDEPLRAMTAPPSTTMMGRPVVSYSFAITHALGDGDIWWHHFGNVLIHLVAGLALYGVLRRTLQGPRLRACFEENGSAAAATCVAFAGALWWMLHPVQTNAVTYLIQRTESLMGMFFLLTMYAAVRAWEPRYKKWMVVAWLVCVLGMGCKEIMILAPAMVMFHDWVFRNDLDVKAILCRRWVLYAGLWLTSVVLFAEVARSERADFIKWRLAYMASPLHYFLTQFKAMFYYLRLCVWPDEVLLHYQWSFVESFGEVWLPALVLAAAAGALVWGAWRRAVWAFAGAWYFVILLPSSSVIPLIEAVHAYRMYLSVAAFTAFAAAGLYLLARRMPSPRARLGAYVAAALVVALPLGWRTAHENAFYADEEAMYRRCLAHNPANTYASHKLAHVLISEGRMDEAFDLLDRTLSLKPDAPDVHLIYARALKYTGRFEEALVHYRRAEEGDIVPFAVTFYDEVGGLQEQLGRYAEAAASYRQLAEKYPDNGHAKYLWGHSLLRSGDTDSAYALLKAALKLDPEHPGVHADLAWMYGARGEYGQAIAHDRDTLRFAPGDAAAAERLTKNLNFRGKQHLAAGRVDQAIPLFREALSRRPGFVDARMNWALALQDRARKALLEPPAQATLRTALKSLAHARVLEPGLSLPSDLEAAVTRRAEAELEAADFAEPDAFAPLSAVHALKGEWKQAAKLADMAAGVAEKAGDAASAKRLARWGAGLCAERFDFEALGWTDEAAAPAASFDAGPAHREAAR